MIKFNRNAFLSGQNILNVSQRTLFSASVLFFEKFQYRRPKYGIKTDDNCQFANQLKNISIPKLLKPNLLTQAVTKNDEHIEVLRQRLIRIYEDTNQKPEDLYQIGPVVMQLFHQLDWPEKALEFYYEFNNQYFDSKRTATILMDRLFDSKRYNDLLKVYRIRSTERKREPSSMHRTCVYAASYKLNTPESLQYAINLQNECKSDMDQNVRIDFIAMLAFNQKKFNLALTLLENNNNNYLSANNIKLLAMAELNDWNGVCNLLQQIKTNGPIDKCYRVSREVFQKVSEKLDLSKEILSPNEWEKCYSCLHKIQHSGVSVLHPQTMDQILCMPIKLKSQNNIQFKGNHTHEPHEAHENNNQI